MPEAKSVWMNLHGRRLEKQDMFFDPGVVVSVQGSVMKVRFENCPAHLLIAGRGAGERYSCYH
jgi:hypothetical protein